MKKRSRSMTVVLAASLLPVVVLAVGCNGCGKKDDDDKPATTASAAPAPTPTPSAPATVVPEEPDAGVDAGIDAGKPPGPGGPGGGAGTLAKCCAALQQNANSAPLDQKIYYMQAAAACQGMRNTPAGQQAFANLRQFLQGAKMPGACAK